MSIQPNARVERDGEDIGLAAQVLPFGNGQEKFASDHGRPLEEGVELFTVHDDFPVRIGDILEMGAAKHTVNWIWPVSKAECAPNFEGVAWLSKSDGGPAGTGA